ncbi:class I glutamine amidotransferase-like protein [Xylariales sp. PMI_506]|nr:class I glutamine amidotransferase-like protein [Xylariales sp. PMI_506]
MTTSPSKPYRIAVMLDEIQLSDIIGIDLITNLSHEYLDNFVAVDPSYEKFREHALSFEIFYLSTSLDPAKFTCSLQFIPNKTYDDCPRDLDLVITGGPWPSHRPPAAAKFMREAWSRTRVWMTTCVGSLWLGSTGLLDGYQSTTNREFLQVAKKVLPKVEWVEQRWVVSDKPYDGEGKGALWTAGAAGAGIDMIAQFCLQNWNKEFVYTLALRTLEFTPEGTHGQFYAKPHGEQVTNEQ